ncbi:MAG TPA: phenylalanine--tRNA ligase subunit beta [Wenzhouxiangella sp.]
MKASLQWLKEWVAFDLDGEALAETLTMAGLEVDEVVDLSAGLEGIVVAEIQSAEQHPDADRLRVCTVSGDSEPRTIVCGAPNAAAGLKAPLATLGTTMPNGMKIKPAKLRGVASEGMLCSASELGLGEGGEAAAGLMALPADAPVGQSLIDYLSLNDTVLDIDLTPNRADCLSIKGIAQEISALTGGAFTAPEVSPVSATSDRVLDVSVAANADCPRYLARIIEGIDLSAETPMWMRERLRRLGVRPLSPIVDVTNYVLLELGQPMHAFDLEKINGGIVVRRASADESITLLDGHKIDLDEDCLVIADHRQPLALAGIMGGLESAVSDQTTEIVLESAWFSPEVMAGRGRRFGLSTESSHRFERGVDPDLQYRAMERATELILEIAGGKPGPITETTDTAHLPHNEVIELSVEAVNRLLGTELSAAQITKALVGLGMSVELDGAQFKVLAPNCRRDIALPVDLIEEVARVVGYDALPSHAPTGELTLTAPAEVLVGDERLRTQLAARGFQEVMTWSFIGTDLRNPDGGQVEGLVLANPLSQEQALMRPSLLPGLLDVVGRNARYGHHTQRLFEVGHCFGKDAETAKLGLVLAGLRVPEHFDSQDNAVDFFDLKGEIEHLLASNQIGPAAFEAGTAHAWVHPAQSATLLINQRPMGWVGRVHPQIAERYDLRKSVIVAELDLEAMGHRKLPSHQPISKFPASRRDLALMVKEDTEAGALLDAVKQVAGQSLEDCVLFDLYQGEGIEKGFKSLGIGLIIRENSRTLTDEDVDAVSEAVVAHLAETFDARLRG